MGRAQHTHRTRTTGPNAWTDRRGRPATARRSAARPPPRPAPAPTGRAPAPVPPRQRPTPRPSRSAASASARRRSPSSRDRSTGASTSFASTVQRSGVTSAKPPATYSWSVICSPSYSAMIPPRSMTIIGAWPSSTPMSPSRGRDHHHVHRPRQQQPLRADDFQVRPA